MALRRGVSGSIARFEATVANAAGELFLGERQLNAELAMPVDRCAERTHLFLVATLYAGLTSSPVRVRNLSTTGALIEGGDLPPVGSEIVLRRGALEASGNIVWTASGRAGLSFPAPVEVADWLPTRERQAQVDRLAFEIKQANGMSAASIVAIDEGVMSMAAIVAELVALRTGLVQLADNLSHDAILVATHPEVQFLDAASQRIGKVVETIEAAQG